MVSGAGLPFSGTQCAMPDPLSADVVIRLRSDPTAALAAALILAGSFPDLVLWAMRAFRPATPAKANGAAGSGPAETAAKHDQALIALMRANPGASVTEIIQLNGRPRNSTMASLERLRKAGLVEHAGRGEWIVADSGPVAVASKAQQKEKAAAANGKSTSHLTEAEQRQELREHVQAQQPAGSNALDREARGTNFPPSVQKAKGNEKAAGTNFPAGAADGRRPTQTHSMRGSVSDPEPPAAWVEPLSGAHKARHAAGGRVRDELTMA
jgi:hypothetical protein